MKYVRSFFSKVAVLGLALTVMSLVASAQAQSKEGTARVQALRGSAQYSEQGGPWQPLAVGKVLRAGTIIKTAAGSEVDLYLKQNGPVVRVTAETTLGLDSLLFEETGADTVVETKLNLSSGRILGKVKKLAAASKYEVKIPTGTVGIRGTDYDISASGVVFVQEGTVTVHYVTPSGKRYDVTVQTGEYFVPPADPESAPAQPVSVPPAGFEPMQWPKPLVELPGGALVQVEIGLDKKPTEPNTGPAQPPIGQPPVHQVQVGLSPDSVPRIRQPSEPAVSPTVGISSGSGFGGSGSGNTGPNNGPPRPVGGPVVIPVGD